MKTNTFLLLSLWLILTGLPNKSFSQQADIILYNGKIFTADESEPFVTAIAIKGNKILATGKDAIIKKLTTSKTKLIDLKGKTIVPGFNDYRFFMLKEADKHLVNRKAAFYGFCFFKKKAFEDLNHLLIISSLINLLNNILYFTPK